MQRKRGFTLLEVLIVVGIVGNLGGGHFSGVFGRPRVLAAASSFEVRPRDDLMEDLVVRRRLVALFS